MELFLAVMFSFITSIKMESVPLCGQPQAPVFYTVGPGTGLADGPGFFRMFHARYCIALKVSLKNVYDESN